MAIVLYKPGNTRKVRGIPCDVLICDEYSYLHNLEAGYFYSPEECYADDEKEDETLELENETEEDGDGIRAMAKDAGISNWHTKKIENLLKELEDMTDG